MQLRVSSEASRYFAGPRLDPILAFESIRCPDRWQPTQQLTLVPRHEGQMATRRATIQQPNHPDAVYAFSDLAADTLPHRFLAEVKFTPPLDWDAMLAYLAARAIPGIETVLGKTYARTLTLDGVFGVLRVTRESVDTLSIALATEAATDLREVARAARRMFDLDAQPAEISERLACDDVIGPLVARRPGIRIPGTWNAFEFSVRVILGQQVSVAGATTLSGRLVRRHGLEAFADPALPGLTHVFPRAASLADLDLSPIGLPRARARSISLSASAVAADTALLDRGGDLTTVITRLVALPGIGPWTANYIATRALRQANAFPESDLGLLRAATKAGHGRLRPPDYAP
jgi:AraC family transcriptional regulator of adaptative response / DNA-3-methyladenine glycosylase II